MIFDATTAGSDLLERRFDACVIGSGPAGITLARRLAAQGFSVALMEAGGLELTARARSSTRARSPGSTTIPSTWRGCATSAAPRTTGAAGAASSTPTTSARTPSPPSAAGRSRSPTSTPTRARPTPSSTCRRPRAGPTCRSTRRGDDFRHVLFRFSRPPTQLRREVPRRDRGLRPHQPLPQRQPRRPAPRRRSRRGDRGDLRHLSAGDAAVRGQRPGSSASAPAGWRTRGCC